MDSLCNMRFAFCVHNGMTQHMAFMDSLRTYDARKEKRMKMGFAETDKFQCPDEKADLWR